MRRARSPSYMTATAATPTISQVRKAGKILRQWWVGRKTAPFLTAAVVDAFDVLDSYRASHQYPLRKATMGLRSMVATIGSAGPVSQRLKRHVSILIKLEREPTMQLSTMQDVAGCRAVVGKCHTCESWKLAG